MSYKQWIIQNVYAALTCITVLPLIVVLLIIVSGSIPVDVNKGNKLTGEAHDRNYNTVTTSTRR